MKNFRTIIRRRYSIIIIIIIIIIITTISRSMTRIWSRERDTYRSREIIDESSYLRDNFNGTTRALHSILPGWLAQARRSNRVRQEARWVFHASVYESSVTHVYSNLSVCEGAVHERELHIAPRAHAA